MLAAENGELEVLKYLVKQGLDLGVTDNDGHDALLLAAANGHLKVLKYFVEEKGLDLKFSVIYNDYDFTNILSVSTPFDDVIEYLMQYEEVVSLINFDAVCNSFENVRKIKERILKNVKMEKIWHLNYCMLVMIGRKTLYLQQN